LKKKTDRRYTCDVLVLLAPGTAGLTGRFAPKSIAAFVDDGGSVLLVTAEWVAPLDCPCSGGHFGTTLAVAVAVWRVAVRG
jgi:hypothetical protein